MSSKLHANVVCHLVHMGLPSWTVSALAPHHDGSVDRAAPRLVAAASGVLHARFVRQYGRQLERRHMSDTAQPQQNRSSSSPLLAMWHDERELARRLLKDELTTRSLLRDYVTFDDGELGRPRAPVRWCRDHAARGGERFGRGLRVRRRRAWSSGRDARTSTESRSARSAAAAVLSGNDGVRGRADAEPATPMIFVIGARRVQGRAKDSCWRPRRRRRGRPSLQLPRDADIRCNKGGTVCAFMRAHPRNGAPRVVARHAWWTPLWWRKAGCD
jgi:hypothetical protein